MKRNCKIVVVGIAAVTLAACATSRDELPAPQENSRLPIPSQLPRPPVPAVVPGQPAQSEQAARGTVQATPQEQELETSRLAALPISRGSIADASHPLARRIVFFGYNSSELNSQSVDLLKLHARYLERFRDVRVRLEGHTDERGSREYNIALGDNRSRSVARILQLQGVDAGQFSTLSYGEEVPLDEGSGESAYRRNRRVELVYEGLN